MLLSNLVQLPCNMRILFPNPETVKPSVVEKLDPYALNESFPEIDPGLMQDDLWHDVFAIRMVFPEHITLLEGRGIIAAMRHKLRSSDEFGKHHLHLNDNMSMVLLCSKGRSGSYGMLRVCRRLAALCLASDIVWHCRWIPSEINVSDKGSRQWEFLRRQDAKSHACEESRKEEILARCYPRAGEHHQPQAAGSCRGSKRPPCRQEAVQSLSTCRTSRKDPVQTSEAAGEDGGQAVQRSDSVRATCNVCPGSHRLSEADSRTETVCKESTFEPYSEEQLRSGLLQICQQHVQSRIRPSRRNKKLSSHHRQLPRLWPEAHAAENQAGSAGLGKGGAADDKTTLAVAFGSFSGNADDTSPSASQCSGHTPDVHSIPSSGGMPRCPNTGSCAAHAGTPALQPVVASSRKASTVESGAFRRKLDAGFAGTPMAGGCAAEADQGTGLSVGHILSPAGEAMESCIKRNRIAHRSRSVIPAKTCRSKPRQVQEAPQPRGSQTTRPMGERRISKTLRGPCSRKPRISQAPKARADPLPGTGTTASSGGPKIFQPTVGLRPLLRYGNKNHISASPQPSTSRTKVLELFCGCARLSRACADVGFQVISYDTDYGPQCDLLDALVVERLLNFIRKQHGSLALVWMGTPCTTWSRARKHDGGPAPLREDYALEGLDHLSDHDRSKVLEGNKLRDISVQIAELCSSLNIPWVIENPLTSRIWLSKPLVNLVNDGATLLRTDFCGWGMPWKKSTGLLTRNFPCLADVSCICHTTKGRCQFSGRKHIILAGKDSSGLWMTRRAQPYPVRLCNRIASLLRQQCTL